MPLTDKQKKVVAAGAIAGVVIGGAALYLASKKKSKKDASDDLFKPTEATKAANAAPAKKEAAPVPPTAESSSVKDASFKTVESVKTAAPTPAAAPSTVAATKAAPAFADRPNATKFPEFYCSVVPSSGWECTSDPAPMPNIGMIMFKKPEFDTMPESEVPGALPAVILTIEDVSVENLSVIELKEKSKQMAFQQIYQMSGGQFRPEVKVDQPQQNGVFEYTLEYAQSIPPYMDMRVSNLITIKNGLAYCFQLVANPQVFEQYKPDFIEMAKSVEVAEEATTTFLSGPLIVNVINGISVKTPTAWSFMTTTAAGDRLVEFKNGSETKTEMITIFKGEPQGLEGYSEVSEAKYDGVAVKTYKDAAGKKTRKASSANGFSIVVAPLKISTSLIDEANLVAVVSSISATDASPPPASRRFINTADGYEIPISTKSSIVYSKIGCGTVIYAPAGMEAMQSGEEAPTGTLRVGNPSNDKSCASSLAEWRERLSGEEGIETISDTTLAGHDAITFTTTEMSEVGPGMRSEVKSKVVIAILENGDTILIRWECPTGPWRRYESQLNTLLNEIILF